MRHRDTQPVRLCRHRPVRALLLLALLTSTACASTSDDAAPPIWAVDPTPLLEIADNDPTGDVRLGETVHVTRLPDGGVLVSDRDLHALRFFDAQGTFVRAVGRKGTGPGEFEYIATAWRCGDSLFVQEIAASRMSVHALDGSLVRAMPAVEFAGGSPSFHSACNAVGTFVHHGWYPFREDAPVGRQRATVPVWLASATGEQRVELGEVPGPEFVAYGYGAGPALLGRTPQLAIGQRSVYVGTADSAVVQVFTLAGELAGVRRLPGPPRRVTEADLERAKRLDSAGQSAAQQRQTREEWALDTPPTTLPAYDAMLVDADDHLWVRRFPAAGDEHAEWTVFDPDGTLVATVLLPPLLTVHEIGRDHIAGIVQDPFTGTHAVLVLSLTRTPRR
jgi:hypothetical protein